MNIDELSLEEDEFIVDKNYAFLEFLGQATPTKKPEVTFVVAQPGAGKTGLAAYSTQEIKQRNNGTTPINVNADKVAEYHRNYSKLLDYIPEERFRVTRKFVNPVIKEIQQTLKNLGVSMVIECTLNSEKKIAFMKELKDAGYKVNINVLSVDELESRVSCLEREACLLSLGNKSRGIDRESHDNAYNNMVKTLRKLVDEECWDNISIYKRGQNCDIPEKIYETTQKGDLEAIEKIQLERNKQRKIILSNPEKYQDRLAKTKNVINLYQRNETLRNYSIKNLQDLQQDFMEKVEDRNNVSR